MRARRRFSDGQREGRRKAERWVGANERTRETKRDDAPKASCYATADLLTYISKQKQRAAGYSAPRQQNTRNQGKRARAAQSTRKHQPPRITLPVLSQPPRLIQRVHESNSSPRTPHILDTLKRYVCVFAWLLQDAHANWG